MSLGVVGRKCGMTRVFTEEGSSIPVTVVEVQPNRVTQVKTAASDGYEALQVTVGEVRPHRLNKPQSGHFVKSGVKSGRGLWEFRISESQRVELGYEFTVAMFEVGQKIDVTGITIGKGYAGVIKRHNFHTQDATHGNSLAHRAPGSIGQNQTPGRVFKGKRMAGQMGNVKRTVQNLEIVRVDKERQILLIRGALPGPKGGGT